MNNVKIKTFRIPKRGSYEDRVNEFLEGKTFIDMKIVPESADHTFDVIIIYRDGEEKNV